MALSGPSGNNIVLEPIGEEGDRTSKLRDATNNKIYIRTKKLEGRGQPGLANFYKLENDDSKQEFLIKADDPGTCVLEGSAYFVEDIGLLPKSLQSSVNFARAGTINTDPPIVISIQPRVIAGSENLLVKPWDELLLGIKRWPNTPLSMDYLAYVSGFTQANIVNMNSDIQWQLAAAIFTSAIVGDESLHCGQFMVEADYRNKISKLVRIDLGARQRFAKARDLSDVDPFLTSKEYQSQGQLGKDYLSYYMDSQLIKYKYALLLAKIDQAKLDQIKQSSKQAIIDQFNNLPDSERQLAIQEVTKIVYKNINPQPQHDDLESLAEEISGLDMARAEKMSKHAKNYIKNLQAELILKINNTNLILDQKELIEGAINNLTENTDKLGSSIQSLETLIKEMLTAVINSEQYNPINVKLATECLILALETVKLKYLEDNNQQDLPLIDARITKYSDLFDCLEYLSLATSKDKKEYIKLLLDALNNDRKIEDVLKQNPALLKTLSTHQSYVGQLSSWATGSKARGGYLAAKLKRKHNLYDENNLLDMAKSNNYQQCKNLLSEPGGAPIARDLEQDELGKTSLHYLIEYNHQDLVIEFIKKSKSGGIISYLRDTSTDLDIPDIHGNTPLHYIYMYGHPELIDAINQANLGKTANKIFDFNKVNLSKKKPAEYMVSDKPTKNKVLRI